MMKKRWIVLLTALLLMIPLWTGALEMEFEKNYVILPEMENAKLYFRNAAKWTFVTRDNYEEHMDLLLARGDTEEQIHARFAEDTLVFEAYSEFLKKDACIRFECMENETSREIWHLKHLSTKERKTFQNDMLEGLVLEKYDTFTFKWGSSTAREESCYCGFTTRPPAAYESGMLELRYYNGKEYIISYAVLGRPASRSTLRSSGETDRLETYCPLRRSSFRGKMLPQLPSFELEEPFPLQTDLGELTVKGKVRSGSKMSAAMDGEKVSVKVDKKGNFTLTLDVQEPGDHEVSITTSHSKHTDRVENFTFNASAQRTPLKMTQWPEFLADAGDQTIAGETDPGAEVIVQLDHTYPVDLVADESGRFSHTFEVMDDQVHEIVITAMGAGKDDVQQIVYFATEYETFKDGLKAFTRNLTDYSIGEMAKDPDRYKGEKVKISVRIKDVTYTEDGLGILCTYNPPSGSKKAKTPLYLRLYGYGQDQINEDMVVTIYGTVTGAETVKTDDGEETRLGILLQYGTYLSSK